MSLMNIYKEHRKEEAKKLEACLIKKYSRPGGLTHMFVRRICSMRQCKSELGRHDKQAAPAHNRIDQFQQEFLHDQGMQKGMPILTTCV
jgi:hypothetical protein